MTSLCMIYINSALSHERLRKLSHHQVLLLFVIIVSTSNIEMKFIMTNKTY